MRQLALDIATKSSPAFGNFVGAANAELIARLRDLATPRHYESLYLWGAARSGRSHLLQATLAAATADGREALYVHGGEIGDELLLPIGGLLLVDDVQQLSEAAQIALFRAINTAPLIGLAIAASGPAAPRALALREDLRTRIGAMLAFELQPPSEQEMVLALRLQAADRGLELDDDVVSYLLTRCRREIGSLLHVLHRLDRLSLEKKRRITVALLREMMLAANESEPD